ncbi:beta-phosphoglucomutase family hydrolase [Mycobacterium sp. 155]|uniref:beta-phosphoglucomutase family hydrolase n=1 Tax=Mycobacterium sp. 155 TaxID=1157943 RepID=UPI000372708C|nr:beta-phosphoglucomutase family hydrolase [Mycobacterium sp. 155]
MAEDHTEERDGDNADLGADLAPKAKAPGLPTQVRACLFDLDGVLTDTASVHERAWKSTFDEYLRRRGDGPGFSDDDYRRYVDGRTREDGVRDFLSSRHIDLPEGNPEDDARADTVHGLAIRKNELFQQLLHRDGVTVFEGSRRYLEAVSRAGVAVAVVSSSMNTRDVLDITGLDKFVACRVDGIVVGEHHLKGKPAPDPYLYAAHLLDVAPAHAAVFEDAVAGVQAGRAGHFGCVVGVDRTGSAAALWNNGADKVVGDLAELLAA